jgi:hypothetical protein
MNATLVLWFLIGMLAGASHVWMMWRASQPPFYGLIWYLPRLLFIGGILFATAVQGGLLPAVAGWLVAYFTLVGVIAMRGPRDTF